VSGLTAGTLTTLWLHPFDLLKTRLQVGAQTATTVASASVPVRPSYYTGSIHAARVLIAHEGWPALWKGLSPNLAGNAAAWGLYFCGFDLVKNAMSEREPLALVRWVSHASRLPAADVTSPRRPRRQLNALEFVLAASFTGVCVSALTNPIWVVKTRMFLDHTPMSATAATAAGLPPHMASKMPPASATGGLAGGEPSASLLGALRSLYAAEGVLGLYRGFVPGLFGVSHGALQFMCYEELKRFRLVQLQRHAVADLAASSSSAAAPQRLPPSHQWSAAETVCMSALSKAFASVCTYPYQVVRSRLQAARGSERTPLRVVLRDTWREGGVQAFYRGGLINLARVMPAACSVFLIYEQVGGYMKRHATHTQA